MFVSRHIGPRARHIELMCKKLGFNSLGDFLEAVIPKEILSPKPIPLPAPMNEPEYLQYAQYLYAKNKRHSSFIGQGYYGTHMPSVIRRNIWENPAWYTAYTPYQSEISQGRLEALWNFQQMLQSLTGLDVANASLLDEGTAVAEGVSLCLRSLKTPNPTVGYSGALFDQSAKVLTTRLEALGISVKVFDEAKLSHGTLPNGDVLVLQYPGREGEINSCLPELVRTARARGVKTVVAADVLALCVLQPPGEWGADVVVGSTQRFGVPMGFGGPSAGYIVARAEYRRQMPGRVVGVSRDARGARVYRLALQTREQHIRRERATSNICTAQVLLAVIASMYAVYHGPQGLKAIAQSVHQKACALRDQLRQLGLRLQHSSFFDTLCVEFKSQAKAFAAYAKERRIGVWVFDADCVGLSVDESTTAKQIAELVECVKGFTNEHKVSSPHSVKSESAWRFGKLHRETAFCAQEVFNTHFSETQLLRYMAHLASKDISLQQAMIPLGSCTMKLNPSAAMQVVGFEDMHPFVPADWAGGYEQMLQELGEFLKTCTGLECCSLQPNSGAQGEFLGLLLIKACLEKKHPNLAFKNTPSWRGDVEGAPGFGAGEVKPEVGDTSRACGSRRSLVCLIPASAHGTNPASAVMAGFEPVGVACDTEGNIDVGDLRKKLEQHKGRVGALMLTYPSTHGVFERGVREIGDLVHSYGARVYLDGANFNALLGHVSLKDLGVDVCHLNLHKSFCIPHGGGGPGAGPVLCTKELGEYLKNFRVSSSPHGSASILQISWAYIRLMGSEGLKKATSVALLNANYIAQRLEPYYKILYRGEGGWVAHECILDLRPFKANGVSVEDVAKRLMDYGFHAPTMAWPVPGTLMIEPTESEDLAELDRFCEAMISIRGELDEVAKGIYLRDDSVFAHAPHSYEVLQGEKWELSYSREKAGFPLPWLRQKKFHLPISRVDNVFGDREITKKCRGC